MRSINQSNVVDIDSVSDLHWCRSNPRRDEGCGRNALKDERVAEPRGGRAILCCPEGSKDIVRIANISLFQGWFFTRRTQYHRGEANGQQSVCKVKLHDWYILRSRSKSPREVESVEGDGEVPGTDIDPSS